MKTVALLCLLLSVVNINCQHETIEDLDDKLEVSFFSGNENYRCLGIFRKQSFEAFF